MGGRIELTDRRTFLVALIVGAVLAILGLIGGLIVIGALLIAVVLTAVTFGRTSFAGLAIGMGSMWAATFLLAAQNCAGPGQPCGATPVDLTPHIVLSAGLVVLGVLALAAAARIQQNDGRLGRQ
jgi:hypothetical protein